MVALTASQYHEGDFAALLGLIARNAAARPAGRTCLMNSDLAWQFYGSAPEENIRLWHDGDRLLAYGWFQPPFELKFDVHTAAEGDPQILGEILAFGEQRRRRFGGSYPFFVDVGSMAEWREALARPTPDPEGPRCLMVSALESDGARSDWLIAQGFEPTHHYEPVLLQTLGASRPQAHSPAGFRVRAVAESELAARVALHRAAWAPGSGFTMAHYRSLRDRREVFDPELDIVAEAPDGVLASYTIGWQDPLSRIGSFEPFGTRPEFRGSGASEAVLMEGLRRLEANGMRAVRIFTACFNQPARRLYERCGFQPLDLNRTYLKRLPA